LIAVATARPGDIVQSGECSGCFSVAGPHFSHDAPRFNRLKKTPQVHVSTAQFAPGRGVSGFDRNPTLKVLDAGLKGRHIGTFGGDRQCRVATSRIVPSGGTSDDADDNDSGRNQGQACSVHGVFSDTIGWSAITPDDGYRGQMRGFIA
jgi:hypothetical protein